MSVQHGGFRSTGSKVPKVFNQVAGTTNFGHEMRRIAIDFLPVSGTGFYRLPPPAPTPVFGFEICVKSTEITYRRRWFLLDDF